MNIVNSACRYNNRDDFIVFLTAATAKWSLTSSAQYHEIVMETLIQELKKQHGEEKEIVQDIVRKAFMPDGPTLV